MVKKALVLWGPKYDPSPQAAEWMKRSKDKIEPILARWDTLTPDQLMQEVCNLKKSCDPKTSYASVVQKLSTSSDCLHRSSFIIMSIRNHNHRLPTSHIHTQ